MPTKPFAYENLLSSCLSKTLIIMMMPMINDVIAVQEMFGTWTGRRDLFISKAAEKGFKYDCSLVLKL